jgi:hypothetical protein
LTPDPPAPPPPPPAETTIKLAPAKKDSFRALFGEKVQFEGKLSGAASGSDRLPVSLVASEFPYEEEVVVDEFNVTPGKSFRVTAKPDFNTRYRVVFGGDALNRAAASKEIQTYVYVSRSSFNVEAKPGGKVIGHWSMRYSGRLQPDPLAGNPVYWYFAKKGQDRARRIARSRFKNVQSGGVRTSVRFKIPTTRQGYRFSVFGCSPFPPRDIGLGDPRPHSCPKKLKVPK